MNKKTVFITYVSDEYYHSIGASKLVKSAKHFHPEIPMIVLDSKAIENFHVRWGLLHPFVINHAFENFDADKVVYFDADSIITGRLDELLDDEHDIIGVRNNNDFGKAGADAAITQDGLAWDEYMNAGLVCTSNKKFVLAWQKANLMYGYLLPFMEQTVLNALRKSFKMHVIDPVDGDAYYGVSGQYGQKDHWESWKELQTRGDDLILNNKIVKVLHHAGGFKPNKLDYYLFNEEARKFLINICE